MKILRFKAIAECPECWNGVKDSCYICHGKGETEVELDLDTVMFELAGRLRHYAYIHDHGGEIDLTDRLD